MKISKEKLTKVRRWSPRLLSCARLMIIDESKLKIVAGIITGNKREQPKWLRPTLEHVAEQLKDLLAKRPEAPKRAEINKRAKKLAEAAQLLLKELTGSDPFGLRVQMMEKHGELMYFAGRDGGAFFDRLKYVADRADALAKSTNGQGRNRAETAVHRPPKQKELCAAIVFRLWNMVRQKSPGVSTDSGKTNDACNACALLWGACGGSSGWGDSEAGWRPYLEWAREQWDRNNEYFWVRAICGAWLTLQRIKGTPNQFRSSG